jgi:hypothetical protein
MKDFIQEFKVLNVWQKSLFFIVMGGFIFLFGAHNHGQARELPPATDCSNVLTANTINLVMDDKTISPQKTHLTVCDTIVIMNKSSQFRQPALGTHPHHLEYPGYEAEVLIGPNETFSVKIVHTGQFLVHDHIDPSIQGNITASSIKP